MKWYEKRTKKQPKIKKQKQKKSKKYEKTQNKKHPKKTTRYIGIIKTTTAGIKPTPPQHNKTPANSNSAKNKEPQQIQSAPKE